MAYIRETILAAMATSAAGITIANGYESTVYAVTRYPTEQEDDVVAQHYILGTPFLFLFDGDPEDVDGMQKDDNAMWVLRPKLRGIIGSNVTNPSTVLNSLIGDVKKWIAANRDSWHASVESTYVRQITILASLTKPHAGFDASLEVRYETTATY